jgi:hypothetical protein
MNLDTDFIIISGILLVMLLSLYTYRKKVKAVLTKSSDADLLLKDIQVYFTNRHPLIDINYSGVKKIIDQNDKSVVSLMIIDHIIMQYFNADIKIDTPRQLQKEMLWSNYEELSIPIKDKIPKDWRKRKEMAFLRDKKSCVRCGQKLEFKNAMPHLLKSIEEHGTYHLDNIVTLCSDCNKVLNLKAKGSNDISLLEAYEHFLSRKTL